MQGCWFAQVGGASRDGLSGEAFDSLEIDATGPHGLQCRCQATIGQTRFGYRAAKLSPGVTPWPAEAGHPLLCARLSTVVFIPKGVEQVRLGCQRWLWWLCVLTWPTVLWAVWMVRSPGCGPLLPSLVAVHMMAQAVLLAGVSAWAVLLPWVRWPRYAPRVRAAVTMVAPIVLRRVAVRRAVVFMGVSFCGAWLTCRTVFEGGDSFGGAARHVCFPGLGDGCVGAGDGGRGTLFPGLMPGAEVVAGLSASAAGVW